MYKADYVIDNGKVSLLFNSWTFRQHCQKIGIEFEDLFTAITEGKAFRSKDLPGLLLIASESFCLFNDLDFKYKEKDAYVWIDEMGGFNSPQLIDLYKIFVSKILNVSPEQFEILLSAAQEPDKKEAPKKKTTVKK